MELNPRSRRLQCLLTFELLKSKSFRTFDRFQLRRTLMKLLATVLTLLVLFTATATAQTWDPELQLKLKASGLYRQRSSHDGGQERVCISDLACQHRHQTEHAAHVR